MAATPTGTSPSPSNPNDEPPTATKTVATNTRRIRKANNVTLAQLSAELKQQGITLSLAGLSKLENGARGISVDELVALAHALDTDVATLLGTSVDTATRTALRELHDLTSRLNQILDAP